MGLSSSLLFWKNSEESSYTNNHTEVQTAGGYSSWQSFPEPLTSAESTRFDTTFEDFQTLSLSGGATSSCQNSHQSSNRDDEIPSCNSNANIFPRTVEDETNVIEDHSTAQSTSCEPVSKNAIQENIGGCNEYNVDDLCCDMIEEIILPESENGENVIVLNVEDDKELSKDLALHLRNKYGCRAAAIEVLDPLFRMCGPQALPAAQKWADILIMIISTSWAQAVKQVRPTHNVDTETAKYHFALIQTDFMQRCCMNHKVIPVIKPGTDPSVYSGILEFRNYYTMDEIKNDFSSVRKFRKVSRRGSEIVRGHPRRLKRATPEGREDGSDKGAQEFSQTDQNNLRRDS